MLARQAMFQGITDCLQAGPRRGKDVSAYIAAHEPRITYAQAMRRVDQGLYRLKAHGVAMEVGEGWRLAYTAYCAILSGSELR